MQPESKQDQQVATLETALLERAKLLASEHQKRAQRARKEIISDNNERLRLREDRETLAAKIKAERTYLQKVQSQELQQQAELDHLRWAHVQNCLSDLDAKLATLHANARRYKTLFTHLLENAANAIGSDDLIAEINATDLQRFGEDWDALISASKLKHAVKLAPVAIHCSGGVLVRNKANTIRIDNTFEGRKARLNEALQRAMVERLFTPGAGRG